MSDEERKILTTIILNVSFGLSNARIVSINIADISGLFVSRSTFN